MDVIRTIIVEDHDLVRKGMRALLASQTDIEVAGEAGDVENARQTIYRTHPDVMLLDIRLANGSGLDVLAYARGASAQTQTIVVTSYLNPVLARACITGGASGYLMKDTENLDLGAAIRVVHRGGTVFDPRVLGLSTQAGSSLESLTPHELRVLAQVCEGFTNAEIAEGTGVSISAVKTCVSTIMRKLGCTNRVRLVLRARELGLA